MELINVQLNETETAVRILDQTLLPNRVEYFDLDTREACYDAIKKLRVRGAPAIGIFAGYAMAVLAKQYPEAQTACGDEAETFRRFRERFRSDAEYLHSSRPTAVNLGWALERMGRVLDPEKPIAENVKLLFAEAKAIREEDAAMCRRIAEYGLTLLKDGDGVLTHCNAGELVASRYGTALAPLLLGTERGMTFHVFSDETRPLLQGARLTCLELVNAGIDTTLICDNMASIVMKSGKVQAVFVGCDRIAANGDFANKIGTSGVAILAKYYGVPFYTLGPTSTVDFNCPDGAHIPIEEREPDEIRTMHYREPMAPAGVKCYNPSFDVTDHSLLTAIVTDRGIVYPPFDVNLRKLCGK